MYNPYFNWEYFRLNASVFLRCDYRINRSQFSLHAHCHWSSRYLKGQRLNLIQIVTSLGAINLLKYEGISHTVFAMVRDC